MAKVDLFDIYEKNVKPALEPCIEEVNYDDLFELDEQDGSFDISDDVLEKLAQRVAEIMKGSVNDDVAND